jgi:integration host factor subunit alpha
VEQSKASRLGRTTGREALHEAVQRAAGIAAAQSKLLVNQVLEEIASTLARGETVKLSSFGMFVVQQKNDRLGRNPKTGEPALISARRVVRFKPSPVLKNAINFSREDLPNVQ